MQKTIIGTGIFNLDTIVVREYPEWPAMRPFVDKEVLQEVGGTCGNVMCMLATMGWKALPVACLDDSAEGLKITEDLKRYGCDCRYVTNTPEGGTTMLWCTHKRTADGKHTMSVRTGSAGGSRFPKRHFLRARDEAPAFLDAFQDKVFIQTMGPGGVRIKEKGGAWYVIEGVRNDVVVDAEGAGDTYTSAFINAMADEKTVADAARKAMKMASRSVGFLGSKGMFQR